jgi:hypothetical protein
MVEYSTAELILKKKILNISLVSQFNKIKDLGQSYCIFRFTDPPCGMFICLFVIEAKTFWNMK